MLHPYLSKPDTRDSGFYALFTARFGETESPFLYMTETTISDYVERIKAS